MLSTVKKPNPPIESSKIDGFIAKVPLMERSGRLRIPSSEEFEKTTAGGASA